MSSPPNERPPAGRGPQNEPNEEAIRERAYEIYMRRGGEPGHEAEDWEQARRELSGQGQAGRHDEQQGSRPTPSVSGRTEMPRTERNVSR